MPVSASTPAETLRKPRCAKVLSKVSSHLCTAKHQTEMKYWGASAAVVRTQLPLYEPHLKAPGVRRA